MFSKVLTFGFNSRKHSMDCLFIKIDDKNTYFSIELLNDCLIELIIKMKVWLKFKLIYNCFQFIE